MLYCPVPPCPVGLPPVDHATVHALDAVSAVPLLAASLFASARWAVFSLAVLIFPWSGVTQTLVEFGAQSLNHLHFRKLAVARDAVFHLHHGLLQFPVGGVGNEEYCLWLASAASSCFLP